MADQHTISGPVSPTSIISPLASLTPAPDLSNIKMEDFTKPHNTNDLLVRKPVKKRKSWGQQLPDPKTNLAPGKRAKTDDEKEQRRIERIKRNRAAAHNSRERKRVEAEYLANANDILVQRIQALQRRLAEQDAQLEKCKELLPEGLPAITHDEIAYDKDYFPDPACVSPVPSALTIDPRASLDLSPDSLSDSVSIKLEESDQSSVFNNQINTPVSAPDLDGDGTLDQTQHSAAMLCDLQCRSSQPSPRSTSQTFLSTILLLSTHTLFLQTYQTLLLAFWQTFPSITFPSTSCPLRAATPLQTSSTLTLLQQLRQQLLSISQRLNPSQTLLLLASWTRHHTNNPAWWSTLAQQQFPLPHLEEALLLAATGRLGSMFSARLLALNDTVQMADGREDLSRRRRLDHVERHAGQRSVEHAVEEPKGPDRKVDLSRQSNKSEPV